MRIVSYAFPWSSRAEIEHKKTTKCNILMLLLDQFPLVHLHISFHVIRYGHRSEALEVKARFLASVEKETVAI